jgi:hypothetical protein
VKQATAKRYIVIISVLLSAYLPLRASAEDTGRTSIQAMFSLCKDERTESRYACTYFVLGVVSTMEFFEIQLKRPKCLQSADMHAVVTDVVRKMKTANPTGWTVLDVAALAIDSAGCKQGQ